MLSPPADELAGSDDLGILPAFREVVRVSGDQIVGLGRLGTLEKDAVIRVGCQRLAGRWIHHDADKVDLLEQHFGPSSI